jgi:arylsulfatase A-like enzyme
VIDPFDAIDIVGIRVSIGVAWDTRCRVRTGERIETLVTIDDGNEGKRSLRSSLVGFLLAACFGVAAESLVLIAQMLDSGYVISLSGRFERVAWVGAASVSIAAIFAIPRFWFKRWSDGSSRQHVVFLAVSGFCAPLWMLGVFLIGSPDAASIRLTGDPILLRARAIAMATVFVPLIGFLLYRRLSGILGNGPIRLAQGVPIVAILSLVTLALVPGRSDVEGRFPDIFIISVDTLRADHLGCYGYPLPTSPEIDEFCGESIVFENAMAPAPATIPSYTSIMTGMLQDGHGVYSNYQKAGAELVTLAELLSDVGYVTGAIIDGSFPGTFANVGQGFGEVVQRGITARSAVFSLSEGLRSMASAPVGALAERFRWEMSPTTHAVERWLSEVPGDRPVFAHFYWPFPHDPYTPPTRFLEELPRPDADPEIIDMIHHYDAEIRFADVQIGRVLDSLRRQRRYQEAWVIFTADHGEELGRWVQDDSGERSRYTGHNRYLFDSSLRVPLVLRPPVSAGVAPRREKSIVSTASIASTILAASGVGAGYEMVLPLPVEPTETMEDRAFSVARSPIKPVDLVSVRKGKWRLIEQRKPEKTLELYSYESGVESPNVAADHPELVLELLGEIHSWDPPDPGSGSVLEDGAPGISDRERERLEALGYVF